MGRRRARSQPEAGFAARLGGQREPAYGLFGLLLAFSFSGAAGRFQRAASDAHHRGGQRDPDRVPSTSTCCRQRPSRRVRDAFTQALLTRGSRRTANSRTCKRREHELAHFGGAQGELWSQAMASRSRVRRLPQTVTPGRRQRGGRRGASGAYGPVGGLHPPFAIFRMLCCWRW
mgnify:CR=1 FL=1